MFENDEPSLTANKVLFNLISPEVEEEVIDPKAKNDPTGVDKKDTPFTKKRKLTTDLERCSLSASQTSNQKRSDSDCK